MSLLSTFRRLRPPTWARRLMPQAQWQGRPDAIHLTFDDGPHPESTPAILRLLKSARWPATFFILGQRAQQYPHLTAAIRADGHQVGNHGHAHLHGWWTPTARYLDNWQRGHHISQSRLFRPPYGKLRPAQYRAVTAAGHRIVMWSVMPYDFADRPASPKEWIPTLQGGDIIVLHDTPRGLRYLEKILPLLQQIINDHGWKAAPLAS